MKNTYNPVNDFSYHLFWDTDRKKLNMERNKHYIIKQVLEYGFMDDWDLIKKYYGIKTISEIAKTFRELDKKALFFIATISNTSPQNYRCYTEKQSTPQHWNF